MRTWGSAAAAAALLALAACSGTGTDVGATTAPASSSSTTSSATGTPSTSGSGPTAGPPTSPHPTTTRPTTQRPTTTRPTTQRPAPTSGLPASLRGHVVARVPTSRRVVALTFDGGAGSQGAASILATLRAHGVPASFFVTGSFASANPGLVRQMAAIGPVGNHSWSHPDLTTLGDGAIRQQLSSTRTAILRADGVDPRPFFRFPFGASDARTLGVVNAEGYAAIGWTTDSLGWKGTSGGMTVDKVVSRVLAGRTAGQVVLLHVGANPDDGSTLDAAALPRVIAGYRQAGFGFTTLDALR